jgi:hypothetical protein
MGGYYTASFEFYQPERQLLIGRVGISALTAYHRV